MSDNLSLDLADHLVAMRSTPLAPAVRLRAQTCVVDALACAFGGRELPWSRAVRGATAATDVGGSVPLWGGAGRRTTTTGAAFANAAAAHALIHEDMHAASRVHTGTMVVAAALAVGHTERVAVHEVLAAVVSGYEAVAHVASWFDTPAFLSSSHRPSSTFGSFGAATVASALLGLDRAQTATALGIAASATSGFTEWAHHGTSDMFAQNGFAARSGVTAAYLAREGMTAPSRIFEGNDGMIAALGGDPAASFAPGTQPAIMETYFKRYASCAFTQEAIEAARQLHLELRAGDDEPMEVVAVEVHGYRMTKDYPGCDNATALDTVVGRQMSNQFNVATVLTHGRITVADLTGDLDAAVADLAARTSVHLDPALESRFPADPAGRVQVRLRDGTTREASATRVGLTESEVVEKFRGYTAGALDPVQQAALLQQLGSDAFPVEALAPLLGAPMVG